MYELAFHEDGSEQVVPIRPAGIVMGRSPDCDVVIKDFGVSRRHAEVVVDGEHCRLIDLKSKNGTQVNGARVPEAVLSDGDQILLGKFELYFRRTLDEKVVLDEEKPMLEEAGTIIRSVGELSKFFLDEKPPEDKTKPREVIPAESGEADELGKINRVLRSLSELAKALISAQPEEVPRRVMDAVFEHIPADRGFLMLYDDEGNLKPRVVHHRHGDDEKITISKTIADRVVQDRVSILTSDAQVDPRFATGDSIRFHGIRSAMCAPLWKGDAVIGIIHVDSPMQTKTFTPDDLELLSALSNYAAIAIQQAALNKKVQEEKIARERLEKYFSPNVATRILSEGEKDVQELEVSVLFADIVGFTPMAEKMSPPSVAKLLNEYFSRMEEPIFEYEGTVDKFIGDCIMAVFGAPYAQEDHAERAVRVALEMRERLNELNIERAGQAPIQMRMGIHSGRAVSGPIGSEKRREFTVLGDTVNIASRIESMVAKEGQIVIGERTFQLLKGDYEFHDLGAVALKGKSKSVRVYEVVSETVVSETAH